jgi:hypothetical protein
MIYERGGGIGIEEGLSSIELKTFQASEWSFAVLRWPSIMISSDFF